MENASVCTFYLRVEYFKILQQQVQMKAYKIDKTYCVHHSSIKSKIFLAILHLFQFFLAVFVFFCS